MNATNPRSSNSRVRRAPEARRPRRRRHSRLRDRGLWRLILDVHSCSERRERPRAPERAQRRGHRRRCILEGVRRRGCAPAGIA